MQIAVEKVESTYDFSRVPPENVMRVHLVVKEDGMKSESVVIETGEVANVECKTPE